MRWKEPKLGALRRVRSRITIELQQNIANTEVCLGIIIIELRPVFFELTVTVTQIANNWKEMNELTVTVTQKI